MHRRVCCDDDSRSAVAFMTLAAAPVSGQRQAVRVLVADDDAEMRSLLAEILRSDGYEVVEASNGRELFWSIETAGKGEGFDLVVSDVRMPGYSGLEVAEAWAEVSGPRVILMTAFADPEVRRRVASLGIRLLDKPFELDKLLELIREIVKSGVRCADSDGTDNR